MARYRNDGVPLSAASCFTGELPAHLSPAATLRLVIHTDCLTLDSSLTVFESTTGSPGQDPGKYRRTPASGDSSITPLNSWECPQLRRRNWFIKPWAPSPSKPRINGMGAIIMFITFSSKHCWFFNVMLSGFENLLSPFSQAICNLQQFGEVYFCINRNFT